MKTARSFGDKVHLISTGGLLTCVEWAGFNLKADDVLKRVKKRGRNVSRQEKVALNDESDEREMLRPYISRPKC